MKVKYFAIRNLVLFTQQGNLISTFDLKSGYVHHTKVIRKFHVFVCKFRTTRCSDASTDDFQSTATSIDNADLLGFEWEHKHYVFTVLPFDLST